MERCYEIQIKEMNQSFPCQEDENILEAMKRWGQAPVRHGCFGGGCGVCKIKVLSGDYRFTKKMSCAHVTEEEKADNIVLMCCMKPCSNLVITRGLDN